MTVDSHAPAALVAAIHSGDIEAVRRLIGETPELARQPLGGPFKTRTALHIVCDWPGYFPNGPRIVPLLIAAGADPNYRDPEPRSETPLHWAASSDDVDVAAALIDGGADVEVQGGSIGTPLDNAVGYACWHVARLLRGAHSGTGAPPSPGAGFDRCRIRGRQGRAHHSPDRRPLNDRAESEPLGACRMWRGTAWQTLIVSDGPGTS
jgi:hypothetical protein